jgi:hypothetical protein
MFNIVQEAKLVEALKPQAGAALTGDYVSLKGYRKAYVVVHVNQANATVVAITIEKATDVSGTGTTPITAVVPIWANEDAVTSDELVAQTAAVGFTTSAATKDKIVVFEIDAALLAAFSAITVKTAASNAANITSALYLLVGARYQGSTPPSAIID